MQLFTRSFLTLFSMIGAFYLSSCVPGTDYEKRIVLPKSQKRIESAIRSTYVVPSGADVTVRYAEQSKFYVAKGATLRAYEKAGINSMIIADDKAKVFDLAGDSRTSSKKLNLHDAESHFRGKPNYRTSRSGTSGRSYKSSHSGVYSSSNYSTSIPEREIIVVEREVEICPPTYHHQHDYHGGRRHEERKERHREERKREFKQENKSDLQDALRKKFKK